MKAFIFKVTLISGMVLTCSGIGRNVNDAMLDACLYLSQTNYPQDDIMDVELIEQEQVRTLCGTLKKIFNQESIAVQQEVVNSELY